GGREPIISTQGKLLLTGLAAAVIVVLAPASASAATQLGQTVLPGTCGGATYLQARSPGDSYTVSHDGVITQWSYYASDKLPGTIKLKVGQATPDFGGMGVGYGFITDESEPQGVLTPSALNTFPTRLSVVAGEVIGLSAFG